MYLTLEVVSAITPGADVTRRKVFTVDGGRIGRAPENDMILTSAGVHRHHATVRFINGVFFIEGVGTNGIAVNNAERVLPRNEPYPLKNGDKVFVDEYELAATISAAAPAEPARPADNSGSRQRPVERTGPGARQPVPLIDTPLQLAAEDLDPLRQLSARGALRPQVAQPASAAWNHSSSLSDHFTPPPPPIAAPPGAGQAIPEDWDKTSFNRSKLQPAPQPQRPQPPIAAPVPASLPSARAGVGERTAAPARPAGAGATFEWEAFLRAAGVDPASVPADTAAVLGHILRTVVQGLIEVLRARSEIKNQFRLPLTQVQVSENNPLKFAANAEDALNTLFGRPNSAYLAPREAFDDAFNDVRFHQLAMLAGVRAGFDSLMSRFDPAHLQESFDKHKRGLFGGGSKARYWELYTERFQELAADGDETFRRLFGEEFARAYEQQLAKLKRGRGGTQR
jgi:type VI secretion system protein ImpI